MYVYIYIFMLYIDKMYTRNGNSKTVLGFQECIFLHINIQFFFVVDNMNTVFDLQICSLDSMLYMYETMYIIILDKTCSILLS